MLPAIPLLIDRNDRLTLLPDGDFDLAAGDRILFASSLFTLNHIKLTLQNANALDYAIDGHADESGGWLWRKLRPANAPARR